MGKPRWWQQHHWPTAATQAKTKFPPQTKLHHTSMKQADTKWAQHTTKLATKIDLNTCMKCSDTRHKPRYTFPASCYQCKKYQKCGHFMSRYLSKTLKWTISMKVKANKMSLNPAPGRKWLFWWWHPHTQCNWHWTFPHLHSKNAEMQRQKANLCHSPNWLHRQLSLHMSGYSIWCKLNSSICLQTSLWWPKTRASTAYGH